MTLDNSSRRLISHPISSKINSWSTRITKRRCINFSLRHARARHSPIFWLIKLSRRFFAAATLFRGCKILSSNFQKLLTISFSSEWQKKSGKSPTGMISGKFFTLNIPFFRKKRNNKIARMQICSVNEIWRMRKFFWNSVFFTRNNNECINFLKIRREWKFATRQDNVTNVRRNFRTPRIMFFLVSEIQIWNEKKKKKLFSNIARMHRK